MGALRAGEELRFVPEAVVDVAAGPSLRSATQTTALPAGFERKILTRLTATVRVQAQPSGGYNVNMDVRGLSKEARASMPRRPRWPGCRGGRCCAWTRRRSGA
jgi:hypothetical protein